MKKILLMLLALVLTINAEAQRGERRTPRGGRPERTMTQIDTAQLAKFAAKKIDTPDGVLHYREACIDAANDNKPALVIYMHGASGRGSDYASGIKALLREPRAETFVTLSGLRTNTPRRGVVINDGKKIIK